MNLGVCKRLVTLGRSRSVQHNRGIHVQVSSKSRRTTAHGPSQPKRNHQYVVGHYRLSEGNRISNGESRETPYRERREPELLGPGTRYSNKHSDQSTPLCRFTRHSTQSQGWLPVHVEVIYIMDTQHLPILIIVTIGARHFSQQNRRQRIDWAAFEASLETLYLESSFATAVDMDTVAKQLMNKEGSVYGYKSPSNLDVASRGPSFTHQSGTRTKTQATQTVGSHSLSQI
ncbi:hypothetical protein EVAR_65530_1 [Eumeta japonica]|uniref:Uncharacterized protein n=1 Tax=Eumeta variegata TaxID=151549 RepID=A0A4C1ZVX8_EUMVA|nr:hypothetical protein EVAR_65530_1 [Eumeta japonica]